MKLAKCGKCGAQFDVASMKPGSAFPCGKCRSMVSVPSDAPPVTVMLSPEEMRRALGEARGVAAPPAAAPAPKAQPKLPPAMQARAQASVAPTRAAPAAAQPAAPQPVAVKAAPAPRPARSHDPAPSATAKSPVALYAGIAGVAVAGVIAFIALSGGDKPQETTAAPMAAPKPAETAAPAPKPKDPAVHDEFLTMPGDEQREALVRRLVTAGSDVAKLEDLHKWLADPKVAANAQATALVPRVVEEALKADGNCEWARVAHGDHKIRELLQNCRDQCTKAFQMQNPEEIAVLERLKSVETSPWADAAEWKKYEEIVAKVRARDEHMKKDPRYLAAEKKRTLIRATEGFKNAELTWVFADPYVIFQEVKQQDVRDTRRIVNEKTGYVTEEPIEDTVNPRKKQENEDWAKKGELFAKRDAIIFTELNQQFRKLFAEPFKLPELHAKDRLLTGIVMWDRSTFDTFLKDTGQPVSPFIRAFYSPPKQMIFHYMGTASLQNLDEIPAEGGFVQKQSDQVTFHEGTHQLQHEYAAIYQDKPLRDGEMRVADRKAMWFEEGLAEFMGAAEAEAGKTEFLEDVKWRHNRILLDRVREARDKNNRESVALWRIKDFLRPNHNGELMSEGEKLAPGRGGNMGSHFYCRVWGFVHFLWYYDNGRYRPQFLEYFREVMAGTQSSEKFATRIMKRPNINDWGSVEKEYEWYWNRLLSRKVEKSQVTGKWSTPSTEAPQGKVEDDAEFCEAWDENHKGGGR